MNVRSILVIGVRFVEARAAARGREKRGECIILQDGIALFKMNVLVLCAVGVQNIGKDYN